MITNGDEILRRVRNGEKLYVTKNKYGDGVGNLLPYDKKTVIYSLETGHPGQYRDLPDLLKNDADIIDATIRGFYVVRERVKSAKQAIKIDELIEVLNEKLEQIRKKSSSK